VKDNNGNGAAVIPDRTAPISLGNGCPTPTSSEHIVAAIDEASGDFRRGHMLDIGSGDGYFLMRAAVLCTACTTFTGIEIERSRWETSMQYRNHPLLQPFREYLEATGKTIDFYYGDATSIHRRKLVYSVTHVYMFDKVFNVNTHFLLSPILDQSRSLRMIATTFSLKKNPWGYLRTFRHVVDATTGERVHKLLTLRKSKNQTFKCWILTRTGSPQASPSTFCAFVPNPPRVIIRSETARSISATVQGILEAHANSTPETAYHAACVYLERFHDASNGFEPFLAKHVRKFLLIRHWLDSCEPIHVQVHRSSGATAAAAAAAASSDSSKPTRTHPDVKIGIHTKRLHGQACPTGKEKVATSSWEDALQRSDLQECSKVSCAQVWAQYKAARANPMHKKPPQAKGKQAASASSASSSSSSASASAALRPHKSTATLQRKTVDPPWRQMDIVCPLYFGQSSLDIDGLLGVYFESSRMEDLMQNPDYRELMLAHKKSDAEAKARQQSDSARFIAAAVAAAAAGAATTTTATSGAVGSKTIRLSNRVPENRDVNQAELLQRLIVQRRAQVDRLDPIVQAISQKIPFVSTYDGFFVTSEELKRCPFSINTTTEIPRHELKSLGLSHATTHNLLLIGNPLAVGPMLNMPLLPPGKEKANFFEFAPNVDHTTRPATQTTTTQSTPIPWVQQPDPDDPDCIAISSACMLLVQLPQPDRQYTDPETRTIERFLLDHDQHELNSNREAFMYYRTDDPQDTNSKKATANWMKQTWGEDDTLREPCHICFRFEQSVENQLVHCKSPRCTRTYHQHCLQPAIAIRHRQPWICPIHATGHAPMPTMVFPSLGRFHPTMVRDEFDGNTTQLADPATNATFVVSSRNQTSRTKYRKWLASMTDDIVDATSVLFWGVSCGSVRPFNEKIGNLFHPANDRHHALSHGDVRPALFHASIRSRMGLGLRARTDIAPNTFLVLDDPETSGVGTSMWSALLSSEFDPSCLAWIHFGVVAPLDSKINAQLVLAQDFADDAFHAIVADNRKKMSDFVVLPLVLKTTRPIAAMEQLFFSNVIMGASDCGPTREALVPYFMRPGMIQYNLDRDRRIVQRLHAVTIGGAASSSSAAAASSSSAAAASSSSAAADLQPTTANSLHVLNLHQAIPRWSELFDEIGIAAAPLDVSDDRGPQKADAVIDAMLSEI
jgi:hypothetical protein